MQRSRAFVSSQSLYSVTSKARIDELPPLEKGHAEDRAKIIAKVRGNLVGLAKHKFASNVIDKVVLCADDEQRRLLTDEVLYDPTAVASMLRDPYAN